MSQAYECDCAVLADGEFVRRPHCLHRDGAVYRMDPEAIGAFGFANNATTFDVRSSCGIFHARRDGRALQTIPFDNGADYFCGGLARYVLNGKYGYMNRALEVVVLPNYDFAFPFDAERGPVCNSCTFQRSGEYTAVGCAFCGAVDTAGVLVLPLQLTSKEYFVRYPPSGCDETIEAGSEE